LAYHRYQVEREIRLHIALDHENIIKLYAAFEDEKNIYMVQEFAGNGDLFEVVRRHGGMFKDKQASRDVIAPFLEAIQHMHSLNIIHRDIKV
jgi:aurora kinase